MEIELSNGQLRLWQWDTGQKVKVPENVPTVHFKWGNVAVPFDVVDGWVEIPPELTQKAGYILLWTYREDHTLDAARIPVERRPKPDGYAYTPTEIKTWESLDGRITALEAANAQSDWDQNDPEGKGFIRNRPFYAEEPPIITNLGNTYDVWDKICTQNGVFLNRDDVEKAALSFIIEGTLYKNIVPRFFFSAYVYNYVAGEYEVTVYENNSQIKCFAAGKEVTNWQIVSVSDKEKVHYLDSKYLDPGILARIEKLEKGCGVACVSSVNGQTGAVTITALPNPNALTFTGAATGNYDGSSTLTVEIPTAADGKSAYEYAVEGGYTGTEEEFSTRLAQEIPAVDSTLTQSDQAADAAAVGDRLSSLSDEKANQADVDKLKEDLYTQVEKTLSTNDDFDWQSGWFENDGTVHEHPYFKHSKVFKTVQGSTITFTDLRAPENYIACIACFSGTKYVPDVSLKGEAYTAFSSGTFTVPENIDGVSFVSYVDGAREITSELTIVEAKGDVNAEKIESIETNIQHMESDIAENYNQIYNVKKYTITDGIDIRGSYYDKNGILNQASNMSTTGIINVPLGIKSIEYTAMRNIDIPTILFFGADMGIVGTVIATTSPVYGDTTYSGYADIPSDAVYMEFSVHNTNNDSSVTVMYSNIESNQKRIEILEKDPLYGKKITCTGNSITSAIYSVPGHGYVEQIADAHGMTVDNHAIWGAIIPQGHPRASGDITDIGCIHDTLDSMDADADIVVMSGSINDCEYYSDESFLGEITGDFSSELDLTTFYGALEDMCKKALQKWAGKPIIYVIEHRMTLDNTGYGQFYLKLHKAIIDVMNKWGISIVDLFNDCPSLKHNDGYKAQYTTGDGTHPNYEGYERFYVPRVYAAIKKLLGI